jgi:hypothetical protein
MAGLPVEPYTERDADDQSDHDSNNQPNQACDVRQVNPVVSVQSSVYSLQLRDRLLITVHRLLNLVPCTGAFEQREADEYSQNQPKDPADDKTY